jgi:prepilin-type N-terminal cleavage/methylation domain-containing protein
MRRGDGMQVGCKPGRGVTLVELLVVIAIATLLVAMIVPALVAARDRTAKQVCESQLHQLSLALGSYREDNDGRLPVVSYMPSTDPEPVYLADVLSPYVGGVARVFHCPRDIASRFERASPNEDKSFFESERSSYWYNPGLGLRLEEYMPFHD